MIIWDVIRLWDISCDQISWDFKYLQAIISIWLKSYYSYLDFIPVSLYSFLYPYPFSSLSTVLYYCTLLSIVDTHCFGHEMWVLLQQLKSWSCFCTKIPLFLPQEEYHLGRLRTLGGLTLCKIWQEVIPLCCCILLGSQWGRDGHQSACM